MIGFDLALVALGLGLVGLIASTVSLLTGVTFEVRRKPRPEAAPAEPLALPPARSRRVITGPPAELAPAPEPGGETQRVTAVPRAATPGEAAEQAILEMMDDDPAAVVGAIRTWLGEDQRR